MAKPRFPSASSSLSIQRAAERLKAGHLVAFPTETVYGLGADATNELAVKRIYEVKGRPLDHPLIVHISSINTLDTWATDVPNYALDLARMFWPGPMTLVLKRKEIAMDFITGGQDSVGIRVPSDPVALELLNRFEQLGGPGIAAPSANRFGQVSPTSAIDVQKEIGNYLSSQDSILEGGSSEIGIESTIIDCRNARPVFLRPGAITISMVESIVESVSESLVDSDVRVSGKLGKHYAPKARVIINQQPKPGQAFIALSSFPTPNGVHRILSPENSGDLAKNLYAGMRMADELGFNELVIVIPDGQGIEVALLDRVSKAAKGR